nr:SAM-dependent methyltransferase [Kibdelosporangium sp. MJ126-NF4]CEL17533.1 O-Methyltransferase involved in polyketide biosynthesis [Kibdelosporangium sp. MJ126-NF4]CTQ91241.1 O-Methyltransferase involved in polyketide biosynthesis [Kibdelosporangium sp. MJ126-NF4]
MSSAAARTATGPMVIVAVDQHETPPLLMDSLARRIVPGVGRVAAALARWGPVRRSLISATEKKIPGLWASMLCRKRYIDDHLLTACHNGIDAVVILGAGFDTRAYRLPIPAHVPVYEVDLPGNVRAKRRRLARIYGAEPQAVTLVAIDFETQSLGDVLAQHGYQGGRTFFVWEAVTQYLTEIAVRETFEFLADAEPGSQLAFTYIRKDFLDGTNMYGGEAAYQEFVLRRRLWHFGLAPENVAGFLATYDWHEAEQAGADELTLRYVAPSARPLRVSEIERSVLAVKPSSDT